MSMCARPAYKGSLTGGAKSLFRLPPKGPPLPRLVLAEAAIDALSVAAIESLRKDTLYAATGGGVGPGTIAALEALLASIAMLPGALLCSAADANGRATAFRRPPPIAGRKIMIPFARLGLPIEGGDWNDVLSARSETRGSTAHANSCHSPNSDPKQAFGPSYSPNEKMCFQSFFMLMTVQPSFFASS